MNTRTEAPPLATSHPLVAVMLRPRSIALLLLTIAVAVVLAALAQWQLGRAVSNGAVIARPTETARPLEAVVKPQTFTPTSAVGQIVTAAGTWVPGDFSVLRNRIDEGRSGYWTIGHFRTEAGDSLAVGMGWTPDRATALRAAAAWNARSTGLPSRVTGRYQQGEPPVVPDGKDELSGELSAAALVNEWHDPGPTYQGYVTLRDAPRGLDSIASPAPVVEVQLNFLNLFYAAEWVIFSLAALYIWYRLMKDVYEKERDEAALDADGPPLQP